LVQATLIIGRDDLHATEQTLVVRQGAEVRAYRISETSFERSALNAGAPAVFEPEPELLGKVEKLKGYEKTKDTAVAPATAPPVPHWLRYAHSSHSP